MPEPLISIDIAAPRRHPCLPLLTECDCLPPSILSTASRTTTMCRPLLPATKTKCLPASSTLFLLSTINSSSVHTEANESEKTISESIQTSDVCPIPSAQDPSPSIHLQLGSNAASRKI